MPIDYIYSIERIEDLCNKFESDVLGIFFDDGKKEQSNTPGFAWTRPYTEGYKVIKACVELCRLLKPSCLDGVDSPLFRRAVDLENPAATNSLKFFKSYLNVVRTQLVLAKIELKAFCSAFNEEEKVRMNEAIENHLHGCNYSCIAMSVSAVESRLLQLMCLTSPDSEPELEKKTLGQLIREYVDNKDNYKNVVLVKHEPLLELCNTYRIFSVHLKKQRITGRLATSVLSLAIEFLVDQNTKPEAIKAQLAASEEAK